ncbi:helix-turn-helix domain-containing protein [Beduini massiliensis]|uniref:helix-turn-helix domain-containing protein n=1 Tax=Beduini massiliensis TaxID=1585974 RepID=UPI00059AAD2F|nr:helix-turn-helix transcriptional regulator [Beduini massiliensis]
MNQLMIGKYIAKKRKEKNLTQIQLAERLNVSNKTISKWENGNCMPDYSVIESLCQELDITVAELMDGEDTEQNSIRIYDNAQMIDLIQRTQQLEKQKNILYGILLILLGIGLFIISRTIVIVHFFSGLLFGIAVGIVLVGVYCIFFHLAKN